MTDQEAMMTAGMTTRDAASLISSLRGAGKPGISLAETGRLRVSDEWVRMEILARKLGVPENPKTNDSATLPENPEIGAILAPEWHLQASENHQTKSDAPEREEPAPARNQLESGRSGAT